MGVQAGIDDTRSWYVVEAGTARTGGALKLYGEDRYSWGNTPTSYRFTGQRHETMGGPAGLYDYRARHYDLWLVPS